MAVIIRHVFPCMQWAKPVVDADACIVGRENERSTPEGLDMPFRM
jgi:hypothetical protein